MYTTAANLGYTPAMYGYGMPVIGQGGASMIAPDGTLSLAGVAQAVTRNLQGQAQQINQLQQQSSAASNGGPGTAGAQGGGNTGNNGGNGQAGGTGSATMLAMQAKVGEYTASLQQGTSIMSGLADAHKSVAQNTK